MESNNNDELKDERTEHLACLHGGLSALVCCLNTMHAHWVNDARTQNKERTERPNDESNDEWTERPNKFDHSTPASITNQQDSG